MNLRPSGYEPDELPDCSIPRHTGAEDRNRTGTVFNHRRILSPVRLPVPPPRLVALRVGLEPTTYRLTAGCSTIELPKTIKLFGFISNIAEENLLSGNFLLSRVVTNQVPSALRGLTSVFGMGTGVSLLLSSPDEPSCIYNLFGQVFDRLVSLSYIHCCTST